MTPSTGSSAGAQGDVTGDVLPRRWLVVGCSGAGKSHFSRALAGLLGLPVIHLDRHYWRPGWVEPPKDVWRRQVVELAAGDAWVMDGNYGGTLEPRLERAEAAVMLDLPTWRCVWGIYRRALRYRGSVRPDLPEGCEERLPNRQFLSYVLTYRWRGRERALKKISAAPHVRFERITSRAEATARLREIERTGLGTG